MLRRLNFGHFPGGELLLVFLPTHLRQCAGHLLHADAAVDWADEGAHVAADAGVLLDGEDAEVAVAFAGEGGDVAALGEVHVGVHEGVAVAGDPTRA